MTRPSIAAGVLPAGAGVAPADVPPPAVWMDGPEGAAHSDGWLAAVPAGAVEAVTAAERAGRSDGMQVVVVAVLPAVTAASRAALQDAADALPAGMDARLDVPAGQPDDPAESRDDRDARRDGRGACRGALAGCRVALAGRALRPAGQAARQHRDDRDVGPEDARRADPDVRQGDDPGHPDAMRRGAA